MNLATIRSILRRRLQDEPVDSSDIPDWSTGELDELINEAYSWVQSEYAKVNPGGLYHIDYTTVETGRWIYPYVRGHIYTVEMAYMSTTDPTGYSDLGPPRDFWLMRHTPPSANQTVQWSNLGRNFAISPVPTATVTDAIQKIWVGTLGLANPTDNPEIPFNHMSIVVRAQMMAYGETGEAKKELREELADYMSAMSLAQPDNYAGNQRLTLVGLGGSTIAR